MKNIALLLCVLNLACFSQTTFQKTYGRSGSQNVSAMITTPDKGYILAGYTDLGGYDAYVVKTDSNGVEQWTKTYGGSDIDAVSNIILTTDGGYMMTGYTQVGNPPTGNRALLLKTDPSGTLQWTKNYGVNYENGNSVVQTSDKGYMVTGATGSFSSSNHLYIFKTDSSGALRWTKKIHGGGCCGYGGSGVQIIKTRDKNNVVLGGEYYQIANMPSMYLAKYGANSTPFWEAYYYSPSGGALSGGHVQQTSDKGFIIGGQVTGGAFLLKVDSLGASQWIKKYACNNCGARTVLETPDKGFVFAGTSSKNMLVCKTDSAGSLQWSMAYGDTTKFSASAVSIIQNADKGFTIAGKATDNTNNNDFYLIKTDSSGRSYCNGFAITPIVTSLNLVGYGGYNKDSLGVDSAIVFQENNIVDTTATFCYNNAGITTSKKEHLIAVFPNPFSHQTILKSPEPIDNGTLSLYDSRGQIVRETKRVQGNEIILQRDDLPRGLYFLRLMEYGKVIAEEKLIITED